MTKGSIGGRGTGRQHCVETSGAATQNNPFRIALPFSPLGSLLFLTFLGPCVLNEERCDHGEDKRQNQD